MKKKIIHCCKTCGRYDSTKYCKHDNVEKFLRLEKHEDCPFWIPIQQGTKYDAFDDKRRHSSFEKSN